MWPQGWRPQCGEGDGSSQEPGKYLQNGCHRSRLTRFIDAESSRYCSRAFFEWNSKSLAHTQAEHEAFPYLHGVSAGCPDPRLDVDTHAYQRWSGTFERLIDETLEILFVGRPGA